MIFTCQLILERKKLLVPKQAEAYIKTTFIRLTSKNIDTKIFECSIDLKKLTVKFCSDIIGNKIL